MNKPYVVVFAGIPGTSKTPIAHYLSCRFELPIFSTDQLRYEVREDLLADDINLPDALEEFDKRRGERLGEILSAKTSFICDGSMDRRWQGFKKELESAGYDWFMINLELSRQFLTKLYDATGRGDFAKNLMEHYLQQHRDFLEKFSSDITLKVDDKIFAERLATASRALENWLEAR